MKFSIVIPVFQNESNLPHTFAKIEQLRPLLTTCDDLEVVLVDDGSTDESWSLIKKYRFSGDISCIRVKLTRNFGQSAATHAGLKHATGDAIGIISADLQEPMEVFQDMLKAWINDHKFVIGERQSRDGGRLSRFFSGMYWRMVRKHAIEGFPKLGFDFCLLDRQVVDDLLRINEKNTSIFVLIYWLGYKPHSILIQRQERKIGRTQWTLAKKLAFTLDTLIGFTYIPARLITMMGLGSALALVIYGAILLVIWSYLDSAPEGWMTIVGLILMLGSMTLFSLGLIAEYLVRILDETRNRPLYLIDESKQSELEQDLG